MMRAYPAIEDAGVPADRQALPEVASKSLRSLAALELLWGARAGLKKAAVAGMIAGLATAFLLPVRFEATTRLMPPENQSGASMAMLQAMAAKAGGALAAASGDLLELKSSGGLLIGILTSETVERRLVQRFNLRKVYGRRLDEEACRELAENTGISEDRHSGILSITVTDHRSERAAGIAAAYVEELNRLVAELSSSQAHRERVFLAERLASVKQSLDEAAKQFSQFSSQNSAIDIKEQGRAMIDAASTLAGELIAAQSELSGLEQIYNPNNVRVRALEARIGELQSRLGQLGGEPAANDLHAQAEATADARSDARNDLRNDLRNSVKPAFRDASGPTANRYPNPFPDRYANLYPDLKKLPLLAVTYSNLMRENKIQETVYEALTQEYEMAKVEEAKEMPSVKVLDQARVPERRSYPPRLRVILVSILLFVACRSAWILGSRSWSEIDRGHPAKRLAEEIFAALRTWAAEWQRRLASTAAAFPRPSSNRPEEGARAIEIAELQEHR